jgi:hypothetical protein
MSSAPQSPSHFRPATPPFGQWITVGSRVFEPGLILKAAEGYQSEPQFLGVYKRSGVMIEDSDRPFRYPNGSGYLPIDRNESRAMRAFALDYLAPVQLAGRRRLRVP